MRTNRRAFLSGTLGALSGCATVTPATAKTSARPLGGVQIATFVADITPPLGEVLAFTCPPNKFVEHPLLAKGIVLREADQTYVLCAMDWCVIVGTTYNSIRERVAKAAGVPVSHVAVQTLHQHTASCYDADAQQMLNKLQGEPPEKGLEFVDVAAARIADAVSKGMGQWRNVTHVGTGWASVDQVASSRRIRQPDGTVLARLSSTKKPEEQKAPEWYIDAYVRSVVFFDFDQQVVRMFYYATHPQSYTERLK